MLEIAAWQIFDPLNTGSKQDTQEPSLHLEQPMMVMSLKKSNQLQSIHSNSDEFVSQTQEVNREVISLHQ